jgi:hypothetical protein
MIEYKNSYLNCDYNRLLRYSNIVDIAVQKESYFLMILPLSGNWHIWGSHSSIIDGYDLIDHHIESLIETHINSVNECFNIYKPEFNYKPIYFTGYSSVTDYLKDLLNHQKSSDFRIKINGEVIFCH